jgi:hypothetical protein
VRSSPPEPAIVDEQTWRTVVGILSDEGRRTTPTTARRYLLSGLVFCGVCGASMNTGGTQHGVRTYKCTARRHLARAAQPIDDFVTAVVIERLSRPDLADLIARDRPDLTHLQIEAMTLRIRRDQLAEDFTVGTLTRSQLQAGTRRIEARLDEIERRLADAAQVTVLAAFIDASGTTSRLGLPRPRPAACPHRHPDDYHASVTRAGPSPIRPVHGADRLEDRVRRRRECVTTPLLVEAATTHSSRSLGWEAWSRLVAPRAELVLPSGEPRLRSRGQPSVVGVPTCRKTCKRDSARCPNPASFGTVTRLPLIRICQDSLSPRSVQQYLTDGGTFCPPPPVRKGPGKGPGEVVPVEERGPF